MSGAEPVVAAAAVSRARWLRPDRRCHRRMMLGCSRRQLRRPRRRRWRVPRDTLPNFVSGNQWDAVVTRRRWSIVRPYLLPRCRRYLLFVAVTVAGIPRGLAADWRSVSTYMPPCSIDQFTDSFLETLASLSAPRLEATKLGALEASSDEPVGSGQAARCANADIGFMAYALALPYVDCNATKPETSDSDRHIRSQSGTSGWFVACLPMTCLALPQESQTVAWNLIWRRFMANPQDCMNSEMTPPLPAQWPGHKAMPPPMIVRLFSDGPLLKPPGREVLLTDESLDGAGEHGQFDIVTVTDSPEQIYMNSSLPWPLRMRNLEPVPGPKPWRFSFFDAERHLLAYVAHLRRHGMGDRLVIYVDAFDTDWLGCRRDLERALQKLGGQVFIGVEVHLHPAGNYDYPYHATSHLDLARRLGVDSNESLPPCTDPDSSERFESWPMNEHDPCLANVGGKFLVHPNGGVYGGQAAALERLLRRLLAHQAALSDRLAVYDKRFNTFGATHQWMWNQYFLDRPHELRPDYGGSFVVNLNGVSANHFDLAKSTRLVRTKHFQRSVCILHSNGGGWADQTFAIVRAAAALHFSPSTEDGVPMHFFDYFSTDGVVADADERAVGRSGRIHRERFVVDTSLCMAKEDPKFMEWSPRLTTYFAVLSSMNLLATSSTPRLEGLQFMIVRPHKGLRRNFTIGGVQTMPLYVGNDLEPLPPPGPQTFNGRVQFGIGHFKLRMRPGDCLAWRCYGRCDMTYMELPRGPRAADRSDVDLRGAWLASIDGGDVEDARVHLTRWLGRAYIIGFEAEVFGMNFYDVLSGV
eukprot:TRINITY_DN22227_c0_g1_i1.p1 TRINITY_DN22227_c0_g1~~TRINITY_DN22227_c0_g1_i1.p1  ORF type:complete len:809 (-),score=104.40 TRINITY_DN22227_c0_g1_i1:80-2506(-)